MFAVVGYAYAVFVVCVLLVVAKMIYGGGAVPELIAAVFPGVVLLAMFTVLLSFCWRYFRTLGLILYAAFCAVGAVIGVADGDEEVMQAVWGLALIGVLIVLLRVFRKTAPQSDAAPIAASDPRRLPG